ncbi:hypothetical protein MBLNU457_1670t1 [Dothideomycetes sp. NU457]
MDCDSAGLSPPARVSGSDSNIFDLALEFGCISLEYYQQLQAVDWENTDFGPQETWGPELRQSVKLALTMNRGCCIYWAPSRSMIYNEAFVLHIRDMHPAVLGNSARTHVKWDWEPIENILLQAEWSGRTVEAADLPVVMTRSDGLLEETFWSFNFVPIKDPHGNVLGVFNQPFERTEQIISARRMKNVLTIGEVGSSALSLEAYWQAVLQSFELKGSEVLSEVPFAAIYSRKLQTGSRDSFDRNQDMLVLEGSTLQYRNCVNFPKTVDLSLDHDLARAFKASSEVDDPPLVVTKDLLGRFMPEAYEDSPFTDSSKLIICPMQVSSTRCAAYVIIGLKDLRQYNEGYKGFVNLLLKQVEAGATSQQVLAEEKKRLERTVEQANSEAQRLYEELEIQKREAAESAWRFLEFAKHAPVGVYTFGPKGEILFANNVWYDMFYLPHGSKGAQIWRDTIHPEDLWMVDEKWQLLVEHGMNHAQFEFRVTGDPRDKSSGERPVKYINSSCFAEMDPQGNLKSVTGVLMDNTIARDHERGVAERLADALEAKRAQENFMDMVSHEMRNPLNAIIQCGEEAAELTEPHTSSPGASPMPVDKAISSLDAINTILYCGHHQKQIIDDVLTISKLDSNLLTLAPTDSDPLAVARQALQIHGSEVRAADITVSMAQSQGVTQPVMMDAGRVLQVLMNLVGNAIKFMKGRPFRKLDITVSTSTEIPQPQGITYAGTGRRRQDATNLPNSEELQTVYINYSITDTGPGLTQQEMSALFGRFKQASPRTHAKYGGSGLGLFICRELTELHGGQIGLKSVPGEGSTFDFYVRGAMSTQSDQDKEVLPAVTQAENHLTAQSSPPVTTAPPPSTEASTADPSKPDSLITVLIVEDNVINQTVLTRQLKRVGFGTVAADNGEQALDQLRKSTLWLANRSKDADTDFTAMDTDPIPISVVLCDLEMPVMDGLTCVKHVREMQQRGDLGQFPMIAVTGNARAEQVQVARDAGFHDVVCKPYSMAKLVPLIKDWAGRAQR